MYKKRAMTVLMLIGAIMMMTIAFSKTLWKYGNLELSQDWKYVPNHYYSPMEGVSSIIEDTDLSNLVGGILGGSERIRGTLYKTVELPRSWQNKDLILYNNVFLDNLKIYINGELYSSQGSFSTTSVESYLSSTQHFIFVKPYTRELRIMILFDGYQNHMPNTDELYLLPSESMLMRLNISFGLTAIGVVSTIYLLWMVWRKPLPQSQKIQELIFVVLLFLRWGFLTNSEVLHTLPITLELWTKLGGVVQILMLCYALVILFDRKKLWRRRLNVSLAVITFIGIMMILLFDFINLKMIILGYTLAVVWIYFLFRKRIRATDRYTEMLIVNACLFLDTLYRLRPFSPPIHLLVLSVYGVIWHHKRAQSDSITMCAEQNANVITERPILSVESKVGLFERLVDHSQMIAICIARAETFYTKTMIDRFNITDKTAYESILFPHDVAQLNYFKEVVELALNTDRLEEKAIYLEILPLKYQHFERSYKMHYSWIEEENCIMAQFEDITEAIEKSNRLEMDIKKRNIIISVLKDRDSFEKFEDDYRRFVMLVRETKESSSVDVITFWSFVTARLSYFTIKLRTFEMLETLAILDLVISDLSLFQEKNDINTLKNYSQLIDQYNLETILDAIFDEVKAVISKEVFSEHRSVSLVQLKILESQIEKIEDLATKQNLMSQLWKTQHVRFKQLVEELNPCVQDIARLLGKKVKTLVIEGDEIYIDQDRVPYFMQASMIIINNAIKHGIESPSERLRKQKPEFGKIEVLLKGNDNEITVAVVDDGKGIDSDLLREKFKQHNAAYADEISKLSDVELINCMISGQYPCEIGVDEPGLRTLKKEVDNLRGDIKISSVFGEKTEIIITIPNEKAYVF